MVEALPEAVDQIKQWLSDSGNVVYVHCQSGISRSATVVIAFLMKCREMELMSAYEQVHRCRPVINPNDGFFRALQSFGEIHCFVDYTTGDSDKREEETRLYNAYQIISQLAFTGVTLPEAQIALERCGGDVSMAANRVLSRFEHQN